MTPSPLTEKYIQDELVKPYLAITKQNFKVTDVANDYIDTDKSAKMIITLENIAI